MSIRQEIQKILDTPTLASLGPERRAGALSLDQCHAALDTLDLAPNQQTLIHSALLLWHDHLDASHDRFMITLRRLGVRSGLSDIGCEASRL